MEKPSKEKLQQACDTIEDLIAWLRENEPYATNSISTLEQAVMELMPEYEYPIEEEDDNESKRRNHKEGN